MRQTKLHYFLTLLMLFALATVNAVADTYTYTWELSANDSKAKTATNDIITITFGGSNLSAQKTYMGYKNGSTLSVSSTTGYTITGISLTFANGYTPTNNSFTANPTGLNEDCTSWSGNASSISITNSASNNDTRITSITVTYSSAASSDATQSINIADLRFEHLTYNPGRSGVAGFDITTSGWMTYTTVSGDDRIYTLLLSSTGSNNSITIAPNSTNSSRKIKQVILYGGGGASTFNNATVTSANTTKYVSESENIGALVWENETGASSATISINSTDRPHIYAISIVTDGAMSWSKQSVKLSFDPPSGTASTSQTDFSIDGRVKASIANGSPESFRADEFSASSVSNSGSSAEFNQYHISTSKVGVNTGSSAGTATITATFAGNTFYETATNGSYTLTIADNSTHTTTITVDDMRISKKVNSNGLNASDNNLDRTLGGFAFTFTSSNNSGEGVKFNNGDGISLRTTTGDSPESGTITITPQKNDNDKTVKITRVDIETYPTSDYTNGTLTVSGLTDDQTLNAVSSYSFANLSNGEGVDVFTMTSKSGTIYIKSFTIYYLDSDGTLNTTKTTPTLTFSKSSDTVTSSDTYTSPTITGTTPNNFDFTITSNNTSVATVAATNWSSASLVSLQGTEGTATITASSAGSTYFNAATDATYTVTVSSTNSKKWDFTTLDVTKTINDTEWSKSGDYYTNKFTTSATTNSATIESGTAYYTTSNTSSQIYELLFGRQNSSGLNTGQIRLWSNYLTVNNSAVVIAVPATEGQSVIVTFDGGNGTTQQGFDFDHATLEGDNTATSIKSDETQRIATLIAGTGGFVTLKFTASKVRLYSIEVKDETRKTLTLADINNTYNRTADTSNTFSHNVSFTASDGATDALTYESDASLLHITSSDSNVLDVSGATVSATNFGSGSTFAFEGIKAIGAGTATLTITFDGNNDYKPTSYTSQVYTVSGALGTFAVEADDQAIQQGQRSPIEPVITNTSGQAIGIRATSGGYETYVLDEEEDLPNYSTYFDFTYTAGSGSGTNYSHITVASDGTISTTEDTGIGATRSIAISATVKDAYKSAFGGNTATASTTITVTVRAKNAGINPCTYYWNSDLTSNEVTGPGDDTDYKVESGSSMGIFGGSGTFGNGFPNGRIMYVKPKNAEDIIFFSYAVNTEPSDFPAQPKLDKDKKHYIYRRGIPIYIDDDFTNGTDYVRINVATASYDASTKKYTLNSSVVKMKFIMTTHDRPAQPTYDPTSPDSDPTLNKDGRKIMNTSQNVVAYGEGASKNVTGDGNLVYGKFSTSSVYTTAQLINEETVTYRIDNVPVVSTEVNKRRFTAVQIKNYTTSESYTEPGGYGDYISEQTYTEYYYLYDTDLRLTPATGQSSINYNINPSTSTPNVPVNTVTWYNKRNYNNSNATGVTQEVDNYEGKITYAITDTYNLTVGTDVSIDPTTGIVTSSTSNQGWVKVTVTYTGGEEHGGKSGEPQYVSTTDKSAADFYVYIYDTSKQRPTITPTTRNFTGTMTYTITAPENWDVVYTTDGNTPTVPSTGTPSSNYIAHDSNPNYHEIKIGDVGNGERQITLAIDATHTVKAIAYNPDDRTAYSAIVSESYTRKEPLPNPVFDPDGTDKDNNGTLDYYYYNTNTLTVQIACAYAGSEIYYTVDGSTPEIGATNTYKYSGLSKVVISGDVTIKAVAYDPVNKIFSNVVPSGYKYSDKMDKPYFQISYDKGSTWYGYNENTWEQNATGWHNGQSHEVTPSTQIRIIDPNAVAGTIFYTLDGSTPSDDTNSLIYFEGYPFTVGKNTTGKAITKLDDASSDVANAVFKITNNDNSYVWEANQYTLTDSVDSEKKGIHIADGFVISTNSELSVANTGTSVNSHSLASGNKLNYTFAQEHITATFGGYDLASWEQMTIADAATGAPIGNVGEYSIKTINNTGIGNGNARDEHNSNYNHVYSYKTTPRDTGDDATPATTHEKTFKVPAIGGYVRFEPEKDGDLTIWCLQQGALLYEDDQYFIDNVLRIRPVYMVDEQGNSLKVKVVNGVPQLWSSARLSENWAKIQATAASNGWMNSAKYQKDNGTWDMIDDEKYAQYLRKSDGVLLSTKPSDFESNKSAYKRLLNKGPNTTETAAIYQLYKADLDKNHVNIGDPIKPFAIHTGSNLSLNDGMYVDDSDDGTGYVLASGGYAKYTFEVKAGKTYFFFAQGSKIGIRGFQFVPTETETRPEVEIDKTATSVSVDGTSKTLAEAVSEYGDQPVNVTLKRNFTTNWTTLVLPFSVSVAQIEKKFGAQTDIIIFDDITDGVTENNTIHMIRHWHKMIVAGTPVIIKPTAAVDNPKFEGVYLETTAIDEITGTHCDDFTMTGTFLKSAGALKKDDWYINGSGNFTYLNIAQADVNGSYCWLRKKTGVEARMLSTGMSDALDEMVFDDDDDDDNTTTGFIGVELPTGKAYVNIMDADTNVYNTSGQIVSKGSVRNLPKGVYIVNGKKMVIK